MGSTANSGVEGQFIRPGGDFSINTLRDVD